MYVLPTISNSGLFYKEGQVEWTARGPALTGVIGCLRLTPKLRPINLDGYFGVDDIGCHYY